MHLLEILLCFYQLGGNRGLRKCVELENVMKQDVSLVATAPHTHTHYAHRLLLLFDGWFNSVDFS